MNASNRALRFFNSPSFLATGHEGSKHALTLSKNVATVDAVGAAARSEQDASAMAMRRAEVLRSFFPKVFTWFASRWDLDGMSEVNHYLSQASDSADLERRIRHLEQRRHFGG